MMTPEDARAFTEKLMGATGRCAAEYASEEIRHEEAFSDQLCGRLKETLEGFSTPNIRWQADVAQPDRGRARLSATTLTKTTEEPLFGADIAMVLDVETEDYSVRKGFLAQAKRLEPGTKMKSDEHRRLLSQCEKMLSVTPSSMILLYHKGGVTPIPAVAALAYGDRDLFNIFSWGMDTLYFDFAVCWYGDPRLQATDKASLEGLRTLVDAEAAIRFEGRSRDLPEASLPPRGRRIRI